MTLQALVAVAGLGVSGGGLLHDEPFEGESREAQESSEVGCH